MDVTSYLLGKKASGGGGGDEKTLDGINEAITKHLQYLQTIPSTYTTLSNEPVTLYTPNENYKKYCIGKTQNGAFRLYWVMDNDILYASASGKVNAYTMILYYDGTTGKIKYSYAYHTIYRSQSTYSSLQAALDAIQSNSTAYQADNMYTVGCQGDSPYYLPCSNTTLVRDSSIDQSQKISSNETIEVIS